MVDVGTRAERQRPTWDGGAGLTSSQAPPPDETVVSSTVRDLVAGSGLRFENRGIHALRGLPNDMHLYTVARVRVNLAFGHRHPTRRKTCMRLSPYPML